MCQDRSLEQNAKESASVSELIIALAIVLIFFAFLYGYNLDGWLVNDDEGSFLYQVWRMGEGERPYVDFLSSRDPLFLFTGAAWMQLWGTDIFPMRLLPVCLTLGTALAVFLLARESLSLKFSLVALIIFLLHPDIFRYSRSFQPEPFYLFFSTFALLFFARGVARERVTYFLLAGLFFALATLYKLLSVLVFIGCLLFLGVSWLRGRREKTPLYFLSSVCPYALVFGITFLWFILAVPGFYDGVIGLNLSQGSEQPLILVLRKGVFFLILYILNYFSLFLFASSELWKGWKGNSKVALLAWQLPTALAFIFLSRELYPRLLLYLVPSLSILVVVALEPLHMFRHSTYLYLIIFGLIVLPWFSSDVQRFLRREVDTRQISEYIQEHTSPTTRVLADYQELNFHALRPSTYLGAEISYVVVDSGQITGAKLIEEIESQSVGMVIIDVSPKTAHQLIRLHDYCVFRDYLSENFVLTGVFPRSDQQIEIWVQ